MIFFIGCANLPVPAVPGAPSAKSMVKKAVTEGTVEVLDVTMVKEGEEGNETLTVTGNAIYHPAKVGAKDFKEYIVDVRIEFYDAQGKVLPFTLTSIDFGEYGKSANVLPNEPFPFKGETWPPYMGEENFKKAVSCKVARFKLIE